MVDSVYRTRSLGVAAQGLPDQYADGKAAKVWAIYIGDKNLRTENYKSFMQKLLGENKDQWILDVACGTGVDSIMLLEEGYKVFSVDASDKMLKYALKERWNRRKEEAFDNWVIEEANWLTLAEEIHKPGEGFDIAICLGNSFSHLPDFERDLKPQKLAISNFKAMLKPGGYLLIDHRNYDYILDTGKTPSKNIYYNSEHIKDIDTSILYVNGQCTLVTMDYTIDVSNLANKFYGKEMDQSKDGESEVDHFRLSYRPQRLEEFTSILKEIFGAHAQHTVYGDFKKLDEFKGDDVPAFYIHLIQNPL